MIDNPRIFIVWLLAIVIFISGAIAFFIWGFSSPDEEGVQTATETSTTTTPSTTVKKPAVKKATTGIAKPESYDALVIYTSNGFSPSTLEIAAGQTIRFLNISQESMRVVSLSSPNVDEYDQSKTSKAGEFYEFTVNKKGIWKYKNYTEPEKMGTIIVK